MTMVKMMRNYLLLLLFFSCSSIAHQLTVVSEKWQGPYDDWDAYYAGVIGEVFQAEGYTVNFKYVSYYRALNLLLNNEADMVLGVYKEEKVAGIYAQYPMDLDVLGVALTPAMNAAWEGVESLADKKVAAVKNMFYEKAIATPLYFQEGATLSGLLKMLSLKRLDAVLAYEEDIIAETGRLGEHADYIIKKNVIALPTYAVFSDSKRGLELSRIFNRGLLALHRSGRLKELMIKHARNLKYYPIIENH